MNPTSYTPAAGEPRHETALVVEEEGYQGALAPRLVSLAMLAWENRRFVWKWVCAGVLLVVCIALSLPNRYESTTRLMPPHTGKSSGMMALAGMASKVGGLGSLTEDMIGMQQESAALLAKALGSDTLLNRLVDKFDLRRIYRVKTTFDARKRLWENTVIAEDRRSGIVTITVSDRDPQRVAALAESYVQELDRLLNQISISGASRERLFLENRLKTVKQDLDSAAGELTQFSSKNATVDIKEQARATVETAAKLQGQLFAKQSELSGLEQIYAPDNTRVRALRGSITELQRQLSRTGAESESPGDYPSLSIRRLPVLGQTYAELYRRTKIQETVYETLTRQYELAKLEEVRQVPTIRVLDPALVPEKKSGPPRTMICLTGLALSLCLSILWLSLRRAWRASNPESPIRAMITRIASDLRRTRLGARSRRRPLVG